MSFQITCCSTADMSAGYFRERDVLWAPFHFTMDGTQYPDDLGASMPFEEFYSRIAGGAMPTTSQVNLEEFLQFFSPILERGRDILHISLSSGLSGSYGSALAARDELMEKYPERKILVLDSLGASSGYGMLVDKACDLRDAGLGIEETYAWLEENRLRLHHWFFSTDLSHYKRGGRISSTSAALGTLLQICPLLNMNTEGKLIQRSKVRLKKNVIQEIVKQMEQHAEDGTAYSGKCFISNSACREDAEAVAAVIRERFPELQGDIVINSVGTVIGSHTGPGTVALFFFGDERVL